MQITGSKMIQWLPFLAWLQLIKIHGCLCSKWNVTYSPTTICALEGSSVNMTCSYTYPTNLSVTNAFWINQDSTEPVDFSRNESYTHRVTVDCGDKNSQCSLHMTNLTKADARYQYYCRITTNEDKDKWIGKPGIVLNILDLKIDSSVGAEGKEGEHVTLTCKQTCPLTSTLSFIWSKDGRPVESKNSNQLQLHPVTRDDGGSYTCAMTGHEKLSPQFMFKVVSMDHGRIILMAVLVGVALLAVVGLLCIMLRFRRHKGTVTMANNTSGENKQNKDDVQHHNTGQVPGQRRAAGTPGDVTAGGADVDGLYSSVQPQRSGQPAGAHRDDVQYASVQFKKPGGSKSSPDQPEGELSVIYSSVQMRA